MCRCVPDSDDGTEMNWGLTRPSLVSLVEKGYVRVGRVTPDKHQKYEISYLTSGRISDIESGRATVCGHANDGSVIARYETSKIKMPVSTWSRPSHNAEIYGTELLKSLIGARSFPFPKSLHAIEDCLRLFVADNPDAVILDFFSGSGTTAHAVMRLNRQDGGRRQSISVTNNEVAADEQAALRSAGLRPGDPDWEKWGICEYITKPRIGAAITGKTPEGKDVEGDYKFPDKHQIAEGFDENVEFFTMTYEAPRGVAHNKAFEAIAPLLWLKAGAAGRRIEKAANDFDVADTYAVLFDLDASKDFLVAVSDAEAVCMAFIVTDDDQAYQMVCAELPRKIESVRLFESYLTNFTINARRG